MPSSYWQQRILADERRATEIAQRASEEMAEMYRTQYLRVVKEIEKLKGEIDYGKELTRTQLWNYARWSKVEESLRGFVTEAVTLDTQVIHDALEREFERVIGKPASDYGGALGRAGNISMSRLEKARILSGEWSGEHYSSRIWKNTNAIADRMRNEITDMLVDGKSTQDIRRAVMREFGVGYHNADRLVRTEVSYVHNQTTLARYKEMGQTQVSILIVEDGKACEICRELPDKPYDIDNAPFLPAHPRCRCCYAPWTYLDRKKWAEEHPEEGSKPEEKLARVDIENGPESLQNQGFSGIIEGEDGQVYRRILNADGTEKFRYLQTDAIQRLDSPKAVAEFFEYTDKYGEKRSPIDASFSKFKLDVQKEAAEGIEWARQTFGLDGLPRQIRRARLGKNTAGEYSLTHNTITFKQGISIENAYATAVHEMAHYVEHMNGDIAEEVYQEAMKNLGQRRKSGWDKDMRRRIVGDLADKDDIAEVLAFSVERHATGRGNDLSEEIFKVFLRKVVGV